MDQKCNRSNLSYRWKERSVNTYFGVARKKSQGVMHIWWLSSTFLLQGQTKKIICQCTGEEMVVLNAEQMSEMQLKKRLIPRRKQVCWRILVRVWRTISYLVWQRSRKLSTFPVFYISLQSCIKSTYHGPFYALEHFYDTITREWKRGNQNIKNQALNMPRNLENIYEVIPK